MAQLKHQLLGHLVIWASLFLAPVVADWRQHDTYCVFGCYTGLEYVDFTDMSESEVSYYGQCSSDSFIRSIYYSTEVYCSPHEVDKGIHAFRRLCKDEAGITLPDYDSVIASLPFGAISYAERVSYPAVLKQPPFSHPVVLDPSFFDLAYASNAGYYNSIGFSMDFAFALLGYWFLVLAIGMANRTYHLLASPPSPTKRPSKIRTWFRRRLLLPATFRTTCQQPLWRVCTIPPRIETCLIVLYLLMSIALIFPIRGIIGHQHRSLYASKFKVQITRYIADRTGILAIANYPLLWLFSARNDPFLWLTGWSYSTFNHFHRWVARLAAVLSIVHSICFSVFYFYTGKGEYEEEWAEAYWYVGAIATVLISLIPLFAALPFRTSHYDIFLVLHIAMALGVLVTTYYHLALVGPYIDQYRGFIWPCVTMWALDRALRLGRIIFHSTKSTTAEAIYDPNAQIIRLDVSRTFRHQPQGPGHFYYVYGPSSLPGWESHPFTLCSWPQATENSGEIGENAQKKQSSESSGHQVNHSFLIRPYAGFTRRLRNQILSSSQSTGPEPQTTSAKAKILLEGPYGVSRDLQNFSDVLFVAGGSGITPAISYTHFLLTATKSTTIHIIWALRQREFAENVCAHELSAAMGHERCRLDVYLTQAASKEKVAVEDAPFTVKDGRPDIEAVVREAHRNCKGRLAVAFCGPRVLADQCRKAVVKTLASGGAEIGVFNETLMW